MHSCGSPLVDDMGMMGITQGWYGDDMSSPVSSPCCHHDMLSPCYQPISSLCHPQCHSHVTPVSSPCCSHHPHVIPIPRFDKTTQDFTQKFCHVKSEAVYNNSAKFRVELLNFVHWSQFFLGGCWIVSLRAQSSIDPLQSPSLVDCGATSHQTVTYWYFPYLHENSLFEWWEYVCKILFYCLNVCGILFLFFSHVGRDTKFWVNLLIFQIFVQITLHCVLSLLWQ